MSQQVRQQACKTQIPPYGLMQRRRPEFRLPSDLRREVFSQVRFVCRHFPRCDVCSSSRK